MSCFNTLTSYNSYMGKLNGGQWLLYYYSGSSYTNLALYLQDSNYKNSFIYKGTDYDYPTVYSFDYYDATSIYWNTSCSSYYYGYFGVYCSVGLCDFQLTVTELSSRNCYESLTNNYQYYQYVPYAPASTKPFFGFYLYLSYPGYSSVSITSTSPIYIWVSTTTPPQSYSFDSGYYNLYLSSYQISSSYPYLYISVQSDASFYLTATETYQTTPTSYPTYYYPTSYPTYYYPTSYPTYYYPTSYPSSYPSYYTKCYLKQTSYTSFCGGDVASITRVSTDDLTNPVYLKETSTYAQVACVGSSVSYKNCGSDSSCSTGYYETLGSCETTNLFDPRINSYGAYKYECTCGGSSVVASMLLFLIVSMYLLTQN